LAKFALMKTRYFLHSLFWLAYLALETYFEFAWIHSSFKKYSSGHIFQLALATEAAMLPHKMLLVYALFALVAQKDKLSQWKWLILPAMLVVFAFILLWQRLVIVYAIAPIIYAEAPENQSVFDLNRINNSLGDLLFVFGIAFALKEYRAAQRNKEQEQNLLKEKLTAELQFLRHQTNPHFLFNTLNNIYALARKKSDQTPEVVLKLSQLLRFMLYECKREQISLTEEVKIIEDYIALEKIRYQDRLVVDFQVLMDNTSEAIAPLILLPFVENAFKHGAGESRFEVKIELKLHLKNGILNFEVENSKEDSETEIRENIGLSNVRRQLELIYTDYELKIANESDKFKVNLQINLRNYARL
jgi:two-component system, LytTR family, sensor kinase